MRLVSCVVVAGLLAYLHSAKSFAWMVVMVLGV